MVPLPPRPAPLPSASRGSFLQQNNILRYVQSFRAHARFNAPCDGEENLIDVVGVLGRGLHEEESVLLCVSVGLVVLDEAVVAQVGLVAGQRDYDIRTRLSLKLFHPVLGSGKRVLEEIYSTRCNCAFICLLFVRT